MNPRLEVAESAETLHGLAVARLGASLLWWIEPALSLEPAAVACIGWGGWPSAPFDELWAWQIPAGIAAPTVAIPGQPMAFLRRLAAMLPRRQRHNEPSVAQLSAKTALHAVRRGKAFVYRWTAEPDGGEFPVWPADAAMRARHGAMHLATLVSEGRATAAQWVMQHDAAGCALWLNAPAPPHAEPAANTRHSP